MNKIDEVMHSLGTHTWSKIVRANTNYYRVCKVCKYIEYNDRFSPTWYESQWNNSGNRAVNSENRFSTLKDIIKKELGIEL